MKTEFDTFYVTWYSRVKHFAQEYVISEAEAENITQDVFLHLYERRDYLDMVTCLPAYLFTITKNRCIDFLRKKVAELDAITAMQDEFTLTLRMKFDSLEVLNTDFPDENSIEARLNHALQILPERCRQIFIMNKLEGKKHSQIAKELNITVNTVESQMGLAYKKLRANLKDCMPLLIFMFVVS